MPEDKKAESSTEDLLKQLREDFTYHKDYWRENYEESAKDMDCAAAIPPIDFTEDRKGRPCIWPDETSQYVKQFNNNLRQNKRSIRIGSKSEGATDKDAEHRQNYIRGIEDASKAPSIYTTAAESCAECAFGYWRVTLVVTGPKGEQEPRLKRIPNWATVYPDPDAQEADFSDQARCFVLDTMRERVFARRYPNAKKRSFTAEDRDQAPGWFNGENITVAEYWVREEYEKEGQKRYKVTQYITNGLEILETNEWIGSWIPIVGVFGEEKYVKSGGQSKRLFLSLIRRMRAPQQMLAYIASQQAEEFGETPRAPLMGWEFLFDVDLHKDIHRIPRAFIGFKTPTDAQWPQQWGAPPLPERNQFIPNAQAYEMAYERWRRAIQSGAGVSPLPTAAQRQNEKSGIALEKIQNEQAVGSFHITDNFMRSLGNTGRQLDELITKLAELDSLPKQLMGKNQKDEDVQIKVAPQDAHDAESEHLPESDFFFAHRGKFEATVSDGPNYLSQREEASAFADHLIQIVPGLGLPPALTQQLLALAIKLKNIGTLGDEMADLLSPPDPNNLPPQAKAILSQAQGHIQQLTQELQKLQLEKLGKVTEMQGKVHLAEMDHVSKMAEADKDRETKLAVAEVMTKAQSILERVEMVHDMMKQFHQQAHDAATQAIDHEHEQGLAQQNAQAASAQSAQDAQQNQAAQEAAPAQ